MKSVLSDCEDHLFSIECEDIILREFLPSDLESFHSLTWQPEIHDYLPGWNVSKEQREEWFFNYELPENKQFLSAVSHNEDIGALRLRMAIILKESGELIGWCCSGIKDELPSPNREIMYAISRDYRNKGLTTQAARGLITFLFEKTNTKTLNAIALTANLSSNKVILKCGFTFQNVVELDDEPYNHYTLEKEAWDGGL